MFELLTEHQFWTAVAIYWIFSAAVSSMPDPAGNGSSGYLWLYRFLHTIAGNITTAFGSKIPGLKTFTLLLGCAARCRHFGLRRALYPDMRSSALPADLEFDHAIVLDAASLSRKELYVAVTRGAKSLTIISSAPILNPLD